MADRLVEGVFIVAGERRKEIPSPTPKRRHHLPRFLGALLMCPLTLTSFLPIGLNFVDYYSLRYRISVPSWRGHPCPGFLTTDVGGVGDPDSYLSDATIFLLTNLGYPGYSHHTQSCCLHSHLSFLAARRTAPASALALGVPRPLPNLRAAFRTSLLVGRPMGG